MSRIKFKELLINKLLLFFPPIFKKLKIKIFEKTLPKLSKEFKNLNVSSQALHKIIKDYKFETVLDIGSGAGAHSYILHNHKKKVTALDFGTSIYSKKKGSNYKNIEYLQIDFYEYKVNKKFDCIWASHVLEHQENPGLFIKKCMELAREDGIIAITVPPMSERVVGGHLTNWNPGILIYNLVVNGLDCSDAAILSYGYNISVIVKNKRRDFVSLNYDFGDIDRLIKYFPSCIYKEGFNGNILEWNW